MESGRWVSIGHIAQKLTRLTQPPIAMKGANVISPVTDEIPGAFGWSDNNTGLG
ncbi:adenylosuccinate synthetase [Anopheles sinensis]|uniref:Adenylosuccinate synthetase n=1 Tax=Anopheles sinensis TaxID=74873 RepID=A0A084W8R8_ANOSI|nr:adenylosuccinate synthetase [Anopheles sinensis]